jgi:hypothetical protein
VSVAPIDNDDFRSAVTILTPNRRIRVCAVPRYIAGQLKPGYAVDQNLTDDFAWVGLGE